MLLSAHHYNNFRHVILHGLNHGAMLRSHLCNLQATAAHIRFKAAAHTCVQCRVTARGPLSTSFTSGAVRKTRCKAAC